MAIAKENGKYFSLTGEQIFAIAGLKALARDIVLVASGSSEKQIQDPLQAAISNLDFVNDQITPVVKDFYKKTGKQLRIGVPLSSIRSIISEPPIVYNSGEHPVKLAFGTTKEKQRAELTEKRLKLFMNANTYRSMVKAFGNLSKDEIIQKFIKNITA